jgi:hypothetical protein
MRYSTEPARGRRWRPLVTAMAVTAVLSGLAGIQANRLVRPQPENPPRLQGISGTSLGKLGLTLGAPVQSPFCELPVRPPKTTGCSVSRQQAERAIGQASVTDAALASVRVLTASRASYHPLVWVMVVRPAGAAAQQGATPCLPVDGSPGPQPCSGSPPILYVVDGVRGQLIWSFAVRP